jgi:outer membrane protein OmpA-like peptidoglycan-associated protein
MRRRTLFTALPPLALAACEAAPSAPPRFVLFFNADSAALEENAILIIQNAAEVAKARPGAPVQVRGFAAPDSGTAAFNRSLAETRARHVADHLVENGVARARIIIEPRGAVPFDQFPTESRRVEIIIG